MKKMISLIMCLLIFNTSLVFAESPTRLLKDQSFNPKTNGWFFSDSQEQKIRFKLIENTYFTKEVELLKANIRLHKNMFENQYIISEKYKDAWLQSDEQLTKVIKKQSRTKIFYLLSGVLLTVGAGLALGLSSKAVR